MITYKWQRKLTVLFYFTYCVIMTMWWRILIKILLYIVTIIRPINQRSICATVNWNIASKTEAVMCMDRWRQVAPHRILYEESDRDDWRPQYCMAFEYFIIEYRKRRRYHVTYRNCGYTCWFPNCFEIKLMLLFFKAIFHYAYTDRICSNLKTLKTTVKLNCIESWEAI